MADWYAGLVRAGSAMHAFDREVLVGLLPAELAGQSVLDLGCGEGIIARAVAARGAAVTGVDPSPRMVEHARAAGTDGPGSVVYAVDDGCVLGTVATGSVGWVVAGLSLNNVPDLDAALTAVRRVLTPDGVLVATVPHPCFEAPHASWTTPGDADGTDEDRNGPARRIVGDYAAEGFWRSDNPTGVRRAGNHHRTLSTYLTALLAHGFALEALTEPLPGPALAAEQPRRAGLPPFLGLRARRLDGCPPSAA